MKRWPQYPQHIRDQVLAAYGTGETAEMVAKRVGVPHKNVVLGMWARGRTAGDIDKVFRSPPTRLMSRQRPKVEAPAPTAADPKAVIVLEEPTPIHNGWGVRLLDLKLDHCRWPVSSSARVADRFCGHPRQAPGPYCPFHRMRAYTGRSQ